MKLNQGSYLGLTVAAGLGMMCVSALEAAEVGERIVLNDNGAWCWYEDERAIIHGGKLIVGSVADASGPGGSARDGNIEIAAFDFNTGQITRFVLHANFQADDHNSPAIFVRPDGRYIAMYAKHGSDRFTRYRISTYPGDPTAWEPEQTFDNGAGTTYSNVYRLSLENGGAGRLYNFARTIDMDPNVLVSDDDGQTWTYGGRLLDWPKPVGDPKFTGQDGTRPYLRYTSDGVDEVHFITTEDHPRAYDNSIYHGVIRGGKVYDSFGNVVDDNLFDGIARRPNEYTRVFDTDTSPLGFAWTTAIRLDRQGRPRILFTARANNSDYNDHRFLYGRFDGTAWHVYEIAKAGGYLFSPEYDYTGLGTLDPDDPDTLYISTKIDPRDDTALAHYEIFKGVTRDGGATWVWTPITENSEVDNLRPILPPSDGLHNALVWFRGVYTSYTNYNVEVVAQILPKRGATFVDALPNTDGTNGNTTIDGALVSFAAGGNATTSNQVQNTTQGSDDRWHLRTGLGANGGAVWETDVPGEENTAPLVTTLTLPPGTYNLYGLFWNTASNTGLWDIAFRVGPTGDFTTFNKDNAILTTEDGSDFDGPVITRDSGRVLLMAPLGKVDVTGPLEIYVNAFDLTVGDERTWYEGIAYEQLTPTCATIPTVTVDALIPPGATTVTINGIHPDAEAVHVYVNGDSLAGSVAGDPPNTPATLTVPVNSLALNDLVSARQVVGGIEHCGFAPSARVGDCIGVPSVSVEGLVEGSTVVVVTGVHPAATQVNVYADGPTLIGSAPAGGADTVRVPVAPLLPTQTISATQVVLGVEGCIPATGRWVPFNIAYVDADPFDGTHGNTTINGAPVDTRTDGNATTSDKMGNAGDGNWHIRSRDTVNGGEVWEAGASETPPVLITRLTLPPGTYDLFGLFWNNAQNNGDWDIQFRVGPTGEFTTFNKSNGILAAADGSDFINPVATREDSGQWLLIAPLGRFELAGPVDIYVNPADLLLNGEDDRTWYDGVGYRVVCNDPFADADRDGDVDQDDFGLFQRCATGPSSSPGLLPPECACFDRDHGGRGDGDVDEHDLEAFLACESGPAVVAARACDD
ncbi:MAG: BNR-4 repeat-containing protein [Phycisphaerae bacterium]